MSPPRELRVMGHLVKRALQVVFALQLSIVLLLMGNHAWRRRHRPQSATAFPVTPPVTVPIGDSRATTFSYGEDLYSDMLAAIESAQHRILFESYIWKSDVVGQRFKDALVRAADRGVEVYVIFDGFANLVVSRRFKRFPDSVHCLVYPVWNQGWWPFSVRRSGRDHRKILAVDRRVAFVGGYNIGSAYATQWRDTHVRIDGPSAWDLDNAFVDFWNLHRRGRLPELLDEGTPHWEPRVRVHRNVPMLWIYPIRGMYLEAIDRARDHIYITQAYFIPDSEIMRHLLAAARRGVDVRILLPENSNHIVADWLARGLFSTLLRGGVRLMRYRRAMVHAKTATIDGQWSTVGTANIDGLSLTGNYEVNVEFYSEKLAAQMESVFATDCSNAHELTLQDWQQRPLVAKFSETLLRPLGPLL